MPRSKKKSNSTVRKPWTKEDLSTLKRLAKAGTSGGGIAKVLKRTAGAVYQQAALNHVKLRSNRRTYR